MLHILITNRSRLLASNLLVLLNGGDKNDVVYGAPFSFNYVILITHECKKLYSCESPSSKFPTSYKDALPLIRRELVFM